MEYGERGQRLWNNLLSRAPELDDETNPDREVAISACRTADRLENLEERCVGADPVIERGTSLVTNPLLVEVRNHGILLARLVAALRLPDAASGHRDERRSARGVQQPSAISVSALERARGMAS